MINKIFDKPSFSLFNNYEVIDKLKKKINEIIDAVNQGGSGGSVLPEVTAEDNGDVLTVIDGVWDKAPLNNEIKYSTNEQIVATWYNGKPIYEKTVIFTKSGTGTITTLVELGISNWDEVWVEEGYFMNANGSVRSPFPVTEVDIYIQVNNPTYPDGDIRTSSSSNGTFVWVLRYTKKTDTANV